MDSSTSPFNDPRDIGRELLPFFTYHWDDSSSSWLPSAFHTPYGPARPPSQPSIEAPECSSQSSMHIVTYNVLFDKFNRGQIETQARFPFIAALLEASNADIIVLQEVTPPFLRHLLKLPWVRQHYWCSDSDSGITISPYGQLVLAKRPFAMYHVRFSSQKTASLCGFQLVGGLWFGVAAVHLTSNYHDGTATDGAEGVTSWAQQRREAQMEVLLNALTAYQSSAIVGDFNYDPQLDTADILLLSDNYVDVWSELRPRDAGFTFDAESNPTAKITSKTLKRRRYDRVCIRKGLLRPLAVRIFGTERCVAGGSLCPSDHFGVSAFFSLPGAAPLRHFASVDSLLLAQSKAIGSPEAEARKRLEIARKIEAVLGVPVGVVGSTALGCVLKDSDLDCVVDLPLQEIFRLLGDANVSMEPNTDPDVVRASIDGVHVDIQRPGDGAASRDVAVLVEAFGAHRQAFISALCFLKLWAQRLGIYGNVFGYPNGLALTVMLVRASQGATTSDALVRNFFHFYSAYDWRQPIIMDNRVHYHAKSNDHIKVGTPSGGVSIVRNATKSTLQVFQDSVQAAKDLEWAELLMQSRDPSGTPSFYHAHSCYVHVEILSNVRATLAKLVGLVIGLEQAKSISCRVYAHLHQHANQGDAACVLIGVDQELLELPALIDDAHAICSIQYYPLCRKRFHFPVAQVIASVKKDVTDINNDNNNNDDVVVDNIDVVVDFEAFAANKTSEEVFKMIKWHPAFEGGLESEIGWDDRFLGLMRKPVASYVPGGAVPFHRVMCFWHNKKLIWWRGEKEQYENVAPTKKAPKDDSEKKKHK